MPKLTNLQAKRTWLESNISLKIKQWGISQFSFKSPNPEKKSKKLIWFNYVSKSDKMKIILSTVENTERDHLRSTHLLSTHLQSQSVAISLVI